MKIELSNGRLEINSMEFKNMEYIQTNEVEIMDVHSYTNDKYEFCIDNKINNEQEFLKAIKVFILNMDEISDNTEIIKMNFENGKFSARAIEREVCTDNLDEDVFLVYYYNIVFDVKIIVDEEAMSKLFN